MENAMSTYAKEMLVIVISSFGILGIAGFLILISPFNKGKTAAAILGGLSALAIVDWLIESITYRIVAMSEYIPTAFGNYPRYNSVPWWTFPVLHNFELPVMYAALFAFPLFLALILARVTRRIAKGN
jgi:hypothetical protein